MSPKCQVCEKSWPEARIEAYYGAEGRRFLCDPCVLPPEPQVTVVFPSGATSQEAHYVATYRPY